MNTMTNVIAANQDFASTLTTFEREYFDKFVGFANKSAENVLEMCHVVFQAFESLKPAAFERFCNAIGTNNEGAAVSKMKTIGRRYDFFKQYANRLPSAWTTLYQLAKMNDEEFISGVERGIINSTMTGKAVSILKPPVNKRGKNACIDLDQKSTSGGITIKLTNVLKAEDRAALIKALEVAAYNFGAQVVEV